MLVSLVIRHFFLVSFNTYETLAASDYFFNGIC